MKDVKISCGGGGAEIQIDGFGPTLCIYNPVVEKIDGRVTRLCFDVGDAIGYELSSAGFPVSTTHYLPYEERIEKLAELYGKLQTDIVVLQAHVLALKEKLARVL